MITIYKRKSGGVILGEFDTVEQFIEAERKVKPRAKEDVQKKVHKHIIGFVSHLKSDLYNAEIVIKKKKNETSNSAKN